MIRARNSSRSLSPCLLLLLLRSAVLKALDSTQSAPSPLVVVVVEVPNRLDGTLQSVSESSSSSLLCSGANVVKISFAVDDKNVDDRRTGLACSSGDSWQVGRKRNRESRERESE